MCIQEKTPVRRSSRLIAIGISQQYFQFCVVGLLGVGIDMAVLFILSSPTMLEWNLSLSKAIAAELAMFNNFVWNDVWTFRTNGSAFKILKCGWEKRFLRFNLICLAGVLISIGLLNFQVFVLHFNPYIANFFAIIIVSFWNFALSFKFGWKREKV